MEANELPDAPWVEIATDVFVFEQQLYLLVADYYSKWIEVKAIAGQTLAHIISCLRTIFSCFGVPCVMRSDNATYYVSEEFKVFAQTWGFEIRTSSPRYPQSNGLAERSVGTVKKLWRKESDKELALLAYRATPLASGYSPSELW